MLRIAFILLGFLFVGSGAVGIVLSGSPTTPFLLLAAACFARSSTRFCAWLLSNPIFVPTIRDWRETRCIPGKSKAVAISSVVIVGLSSIVFAIDGNALKLLVAGLLLFPTTVLWKIQTTESLAPAEIDRQR